MIAVQCGQCYNRATDKVGRDHREGSTLLPGGAKEGIKLKGSSELGFND